MKIMETNVFHETNDTELYTKCKTVAITEMNRVVFSKEAMRRICQASAT